MVLALHDLHDLLVGSAHIDSANNAACDYSSFNFLNFFTAHKSRKKVLILRQRLLIVLSLRGKVTSVANPWWASCFFVGRSYFAKKFNVLREGVIFFQCKRK